MRKLPLHWELVEADLGSGIGARRRQYRHSPIRSSPRRSPPALIPELRDYPSIRREVKYGENSRVDFLLEGPARPPCYVEVKNVHLMRKPRLCRISRRRDRARRQASATSWPPWSQRAHAPCMLFVIQIGSAERFALARDIDPAYAAAFDRARAGRRRGAGLALRHHVEGIEMAAPVPIVSGVKPSGRNRAPRDCLRCPRVCLHCRCSSGLRAAYTSG